MKSGSADISKNASSIRRFVNLLTSWSRVVLQRNAIVPFLIVCLVVATYSKVNYNKGQDLSEMSLDRPGRGRTEDVVRRESGNPKDVARNSSKDITYMEKAFTVKADFHSPILDFHGFDCSKIISGNRQYIKEANAYQEKHTIRNESSNIARLSQHLDNCTAFKSQSGYVLNPLFQEELDFPLGFSVLLYKDVDQMESLLRAIYRPHNYYCLHVDNKASQTVKELTAKLASCFHNVFISSRSIDVHWGWFSVVEPDLVCMEDLWTKSKKWKYFINLTGQEYPLKTNLELVRILKAQDGANMINAADMKRFSKSNRDRLKYSYVLDNGKPRKIRRKSKFKHTIKWAKGSVHIAATRQFVDYVLHSQVGKDLIDWVRDTAHASEHLFNPLQMSPGLNVPGSYTGTKSSNFNNVRYKLWLGSKGICAGKYKRTICILGTGDISSLIKSNALFVNKFHADYQPLGRRCLEDWHFKKVQRDIEARGQNFLDMNLYNSTELVLNHLKIPQN